MEKDIALSQELPEFKSRSRDDVLAYITLMLTNHAGVVALHELKQYNDGHYRAIFRPEYFAQAEPTKSQWNSLKKKMKRHDDKVFIFKDHGEINCPPAKCYYLDFGFFAK